MRNLKKILALVMALVMSLSLVTIANASDFTDSDDITYEEAADVMSAIGIIEGFEDGSFDPDGTLTREQAAMLVARMLLGTNADRLGIEDSTFNDVAVTRWSAPAIEYCVSLGIIDGAGDGNFYPAGQLTGYAFAKILLTAIGYSSEKEGLTGTSWSVNTAALAMDVGLDEGLENGISSAVLSREEAAQMALNAIKTPLVAYDNDATITVNGAEVSIGSGDAYYITSTLAREQRISEEQLTNSNLYTVEFGERYFPNLRLNQETDEFERPSYTWVYENTELGTYVNYDMLEETYTEGVTGRELYDLLGSSTIADYSLAYYVDGVSSDVIRESNMIRTNTRDYDTTDNGVLTQVFVDHTNEEITITSVNTYLAQANADYNESRGELSLTVYYANATGSGKTVDVEDIDSITGYEEGDFMLVNLSGKDSGSSAIANMDVVRVNDVESMVDCTVTRFSKGSYVTVDGEQYDYAAKAYYKDGVLDVYDNNNLTDYTYTFYMDQYGYVIGAEIYEGEANYLFLTGYDMNGSNLSVTTATAAAIFLDGTMSEIRVDVSDTNENIRDYNNATTGTTRDYDLLSSNGVNNGESEYNCWFRYTTRESNGSLVYVLEPAQRWVNQAATVTGDEINSANVRVSDGSGTRAYGNDDSVYITVDTGAVDLTTHMGITEVTGIYTGVQSVDLEVYSTTQNKLESTPKYSIFAVYDENQYIIGAVIIGEDINNTQNYAYILDSDAQSEWNEGNTYFWDVEAVVDGEIVDLTIEDSYSAIRRVRSAVQAQNGAMCRVTYNAEGHVTDIELCTDTAYGDLLDDYVYGSTTWTGVVNGVDYGTGTDYINREIDPDFDKVYNVEIPSTARRALNLEGNTLYIGNGDDYGLTILNGAPIIVVQDEVDENGNNPKFTATSYSSVSAALDALADKNSFSGWLSAVLNSNGTAAYLVINSNDPVGIITDNGSSGSASNFDYSYRITDWGMLSLQITNFDRPEWIPDSAVVTANFNIYADGAYIGQTGNLTIPAYSNSVSYTSTMGAYAPGSNITVTLASDSYTRVKVRYVNGDTGAEMAANTSNFVYVPTTEMDVGDRTFNFQLNKQSNDNVTTTVTQGNSARGTYTTRANYNYNPFNLTSAVDDSNWVVVTITGLENAKDQYSVTELTTPTAVGATGKTITVSASQTTAIPSGTTVRLTATLDTAVANTSRPLQVTMNNGTTFTFPNDNSTTRVSVDIVVENNVIISSVSNAVELDAPTITGITWNDVNRDSYWNANDTFTLYFSDAVTAAPGMSSGGSVSVTTLALADDYMSATYQITGVTGTDTLTIAAGAVTLDNGFQSIQGYTIAVSAAQGAANSGLTLTPVP